MTAARAAWVEARAAYARTEAFLFYAGPIDGLGGPVKRINAWPVDAAFLDYVEGDPAAGLVNDPSIPLDRATIVRMDQATGEADVTTGWHAIEFLLWGQDLGGTAPGARPHTDYHPGEGNNDRRRDYLALLCRLLVSDLSTLVAAWAPDTNNYRGAILAMDQRNAIGRAFNGMAVLAGYELALKRINAGLRRPGGAYEQSRFSGNTAADHADALAGIKDVYLGAGAAEGAGFDDLLASLDPPLNDRVLAALERAERAVAVLGQRPFDRVLASASGSPERAEAEAAVAALKELAGALRAAGNRLGVLVLIPGL
jgi:putative iron-regulated protein